MKSLCLCFIMAGVALLNFGCAGGKKVSILEQQIAMLEQKSDALEAQLQQVQKERDALVLDKTLQKAELDILRRDLNSLRAAHDSLQALGVPPAETAMIAPPPEDLPVISPAADFQRGYEQALALFQEKQYTKSAQSFAALLEGNRNHRLAGNCQYWIGECLYAQSRFGDALAEFQKVFLYPNNFKSDVSQFKIALCHLQMGRNEEARAEFNRLIEAYPSSEFVIRARAHLEKLP